MAATGGLFSGGHGLQEPVAGGAEGSPEAQEGAE